MLTQILDTQETAQRINQEDESMKSHKKMIKVTTQIEENHVAQKEETETQTKI